MGSGLHELGFKSLAILDGGRVDAELNGHLSLVSRDTQDRPGDAKCRTVTIKIKFEPQVEQDGFVSGVNMYVDIESRLPAYKSKPYSVGLRRKGSNQAMFVFNEDSLGNVDQGTLDYDGDDE